MNKQQGLKILVALAVFGVGRYAIGAEVGDTMPVCMVSPAGETQMEDLRRHKGQVLYVDFWASWCGPCAKSFPFLNEMHQQFKDKGLKIVGVNLDEELADAQDFLAEHPVGFSIVTDASMQCAKDFGVKAMPSSYLIDRKGIIHAIHLGFRSGDAKDLRVLVEKLLSDKVTGS